MVALNPHFYSPPTPTRLCSHGSHHVQSCHRRRDQLCNIQQRHKQAAGFWHTVKAGETIWPTSSSLPILRARTSSLYFTSLPSWVSEFSAGRQQQNAERHGGPWPASTKLPAIGLCTCVQGDNTGGQAAPSPAAVPVHPFVTNSRGNRMQ